MTVIPLSQPRLYSLGAVLFFVLWQRSHQQARCEYIYTECSSVNDVSPIYKRGKDA